MIDQKPYIIVEEGQGLKDIALMLFGSVDGISSLLTDNAGLNDEPLHAGQKLYYSPAVLNKEVVDYYTKNAYGPASAGTMNDAPLPPPGAPVGSVLIHLFELADVAVSAPGEYTVAPSEIINQDSVLVEQLSPGEQYQVIVFSGIRDIGPPYTNSIIPA